MAALKDLAQDYREAAALLRLGLEDAKERLPALDGPEREKLEKEIKQMRIMLRETRDLRRLCEGYYTRDRDGRYTTSGLRANRVNAEK